MKTILLLSFSLPSIVLLFMGKSPAASAPEAAPSAVLRPMEEGALQGEHVYFFMETESKQCSLQAGDKTDKYYVVTAGVKTAAYKDHHNWLERFAESLHRQYPQAKGLGDGLTFSFYFTEEDARAYRQQQIERKRAEGYQIIEVAMPERNGTKSHPESTNIVP